ncbi:MAG: glycosyltransferase, partial [Armatimonadota bacterium]|nr:glycosyltransferase [Armatimonadota bacterium]
VSAARNRGLAELSSEAESFIFLDADDLWEPDTLETLAAALDATPDAVGAHGFARFVDAQGQPCRVGEMEKWTRERKIACGSRILPLPPDAPTTFAALALFDCIAIGTALVRASAVPQCRGFAMSMTHAEDWDWWLQVARAGDFVFVNQLVLNYRQHESNASRHSRRATEGEQSLSRAWAVDPDSTPEQRRLVCVAYHLREKTMGRRRLDWAGSSLKQRQFVEAAKHLRHAARSFVRSLRPLS